VDPGGLPLALHTLRRSAEPAVVLSGLARLCVPCFSDGCSVELSEGLDPVFKVSFPSPGEDPGPRSELWHGSDPPTGTTVVTAFDMPSADGCPSFSGHVMHSWTRQPLAAGGRVIARLLVDHALAVIRHERLAERARAAEERSALLAREAMAGQSIGEAVGIVMATRHLGRMAALDLLKDASRQSGCSLHEVSAHLVQGLTCTPTDSPDQPAASLPLVLSLEHRRCTTFRSK
jgi:ANTAR domain